MNTNNNINITNIKYDKSYSFSKGQEHFTDIPEVNPIPTNSIIYKTITGIGATHSEIVAKRNSIIIFPHISIVTSKHEAYKNEHNTLAIYGDVKYPEIYEYLTSDSEYAKILTTPKGLDKIIKVMQVFGNEFDYTKMFFLLLDECHKLVQDAEYRKDMIEVMDHFFDFERKAMISATPIPPSDIRFKKNDFKSIRVCPDYNYKQDVELIHADSLINGLERYFRENDVEHYYIFFNSVEGINNIVKHFGFDDYMIYCSRKSSDLLRLKNERNTSYAIGGFKRFNFLTSSFFNGLDITLDYEPNIVILTDYGFRGHTILDPYTDILQIIGRFRKHYPEDVPYRKVTHINNAMHFTSPISNSEAKHKVELSKNAYELVETLKHATGKEELTNLFDDALTTLKPFSRLRNKKGELCSFLYDNYLDDERVKNYYKGPEALRNAYNSTQLYRVDNKRDPYKNAELIKLQNKSIRYSKEVSQLMANALDDLEQYEGLHEYHTQRSIIAKLSYLIFEAYERLGYAVISQLKFRKRAIENAILKLNVREGKNSFPVINLVYSQFRLNTKYTWSAVKAKLQEVFDEFNINYTAKASDVEMYFEFKETKKDESRAYIFLRYKLFPVAEQKHI